MHGIVNRGVVDVGHVITCFDLYCRLHYNYQRVQFHLLRPSNILESTVGLIIFKETEFG